MRATVLLCHIVGSSSLALLQKQSAFWPLHCNYTGFRNVNSLCKNCSKDVRTTFSRNAMKKPIGKVFTVQ